MSRVFKLRGVDVYEVLDCRPVSDGRTEVAPKTESMRELETFTERLAGCEGLDAEHDENGGQSDERHLGRGR